MRRGLWPALCAAMLFVLGACSAPPSPHPTRQGRAPAGSAAVPQYQHVVVVMEENRSYRQIIGSPHAPYENFLAGHGVNFTNAHARFHPSQPNYLEFFSGSAHGITDDHCITDRINQPSLGGQLLAAGKTFAAYADGLPRRGSTACQAGAYHRYHNVPLSFNDVPAADVLPFSSFPLTDYRQLPALSWVTPDYDHDMHNGTIAAGDAWLRDHLGGYARWASTHDSLLMVVFDEDDDNTTKNHIPVILYGAHLSAGPADAPITHDTLLALIEDSFAVPRLGGAISQRVPDIFETTAP